MPGVLAWFAPPSPSGKRSAARSGGGRGGLSAVSGVRTQCRLASCPGSGIATTSAPPAPPAPSASRRGSAFHDREDFYTLFGYKTLRDHERRTPRRIPRSPRTAGKGPGITAAAVAASRETTGYPGKRRQARFPEPGRLLRHKLTGIGAGHPKLQTNPGGRPAGAGAPPGPGRARIAESRVWLHHAPSVRLCIDMAAWAWAGPASGAWAGPASGAWAEPASCEAIPAA